MENLWKVKEMGYGLTDLADRAEYNRLLKRFQEEEHLANTANLLFGESALDEGNLPGKFK